MDTQTVSLTAWFHPREQKERKIKWEIAGHDEMWTVVPSVKGLSEALGCIEALIHSSSAQCEQTEVATVHRH